LFSAAINARVVVLVKVDAFPMPFATIVLLVIALSFVAQYAGLSVLDKLTKDIDEWAELKKGNVAVALIMAAVVIAIAVVSQGVASLLRALLG
jgi:uncharacterized membrane protein YjfL (UPF0719 family)